MPHIEDELLGGIMSNVPHNLSHDSLIAHGPFAVLICYTNPIKSPPWDISVVLDRAGNLLYVLYNSI